MEPRLEVPLVERRQREGEGKQAVTLGNNTCAVQLGTHCHIPLASQDPLFGFVRATYQTTVIIVVRDDDSMAYRNRRSHEELERLSPVFAPLIFIFRFCAALSISATIYRWHRESISEADWWILTSSCQQISPSCPIPIRAQRTKLPFRSGHCRMVSFTEKTRIISRNSENPILLTIWSVYISVLRKQRSSYKY